MDQVLSVRSLGSERESGTPSTAPVRLSGWTVRSGTSPGTRDSLMELKTSQSLGDSVCSKQLFYRGRLFSTAVARGGRVYELR